MNESEVRAAAIRRAQMQAIADLGKLDRAGLDALASLYRDALDQLTARWSNYADPQGFVQLQYLGQMIDSIDIVLDALASSEASLLVSGITEAAGYSAVVAVAADNVLDISRAVDAVTKLQSNDGVQLSTRLWKNNQQARKSLGDAVRVAVVRGDSAHKAAREYLRQGQPVPGDIQADMRSSNITAINKTVKTAMLGKDEASLLANMQRVFRTEINRAQNLAYVDSLDGVDDVAGYKFTLSSGHKRRDICDMHAGANLYGMGRGVYPKSVIRRIFPAHPNTTSFIRAVFVDEVTDADKVKDSSRVEWLKKQSATLQDQVLGKQKGQWLREGKLTERLLGSKVSSLKKRFNE